jgi:hypothetical protein
MITFENDPVNYCARFPDSRCNAPVVNVVPYHPGNFRTSSGSAEDDYIRQRLGEIEHLLAAATAPGQLFPSQGKRYIRSLLTEKKKLLKQLAAYNRKYGISGALSGLNDLADGPALIDAATKGVVNVVQAVKPPKPVPQPWSPIPQGMDWGTIALYAGAVIGGVYLFKKLGKKR